MLTTSRQFRRLGMVALLLTGFFVTLFRPPLAYAGGVVGNGTPASCTEAAFNAALVDGGLITFNCGGAKTITFTSYKQISADTTLDGGGVITLSGGNAASLFQVFDSKSLTLKNITLAEGRSVGMAAGAIENFGTTTISNSTLRDNVSTTNGGAIVNYGTLNLSSTTLSKNQAESNGGAIYNDGGTVTINNSQVIENVALSKGGSGGGLANWAGTANIQSSTFSYNSNDYRGGAININNGTVNIQSSTFSQNSSRLGGAIHLNGGTTFITASLITNNSAVYGAGISNSGAMVISQTTVSLNRVTGSGGGIYNDGEATLNRVMINGNTAENEGGGIYLASDMALTDSTLNGNIAERGGGGLFSDTGLVTLTNVTVSGNHANTNGGGGIYHNSGLMSLTFVSVVSNTATALGGGIYSNDAGEMSLKNTLLANNSADNCGGSGFSSLGHNLANDDSCNDVLNQPTDKRGTTVALPLGALANNGGPTLTHLPLSGNPAINGGVCVDGISTDQRGLPRLVGPACDAGAVEVGSMGGRVAVYLPIVVK